MFYNCINCDKVFKQKTNWHYACSKDCRNSFWKNSKDLFSIYTFFYKSKGIKYPTRGLFIKEFKLMER